MNTENKSYSIYGTVYECCFYNNGYYEGVRVFINANDLLFEFDEKINESQIVYLLKGFHIFSYNGKRGSVKTK